MALADFVTRNPRAHFVRRPAPLPPELRTIWRIGVVLIVMRICGWKKECRISLRRLHTIGWALQSPRTLAALERQLNGGSIPGGPFVSVDPALNLAVDFTIGEGLAKRAGGGRLVLTDGGWEAANEILDSDVLLFEAQAARGLKRIATEAGVADLLRKAREHDEDSDAACSRGDGERSLRTCVELSRRFGCSSRTQHQWEVDLPDVDPVRTRPGRHAHRKAPGPPSARCV